MKHYIGVKEIDAKPMNRGDYNEYRGWTISEDENPADEGYLVKYPDGYESWSPKEVFEKAYTEYDGTGLMSTVNGMRSANYEERFQAEFSQLCIRLASLHEMLEKYLNGTLDFKPSCSYNLLHRQYVHMSDYMRTLLTRAYVEDIDVDVPEELKQEAMK